jgi:hypothetical protein
MNAGRGMGGGSGDHRRKGWLGQQGFSGPADLRRARGTESQIGGRHDADRAGPHVAAPRPRRSSERRPILNDVAAPNGPVQATTSQRIRDLSGGATDYRIRRRGLSTDPFERLTLMMLGETGLVETVTRPARSLRVSWRRPVATTSDDMAVNCRREFLEHASLGRLQQALRPVCRSCYGTHADAALARSLLTHHPPPTCPGLHRNKIENPR